MSLGSRKLLAAAVIYLTYAAYASAAPRPAVQRGAALVLETRFNQDIKLQAASLSWQTYDEIGPRQKGMARAFRCEAEIVANAESLTLSCKVPLDVADGNYYLTSISVRANDFAQTYNWIDEPFDIHVQIRGGQEGVPRVKSVVLK